MEAIRRARPGASRRRSLPPAIRQTGALLFVGAMIAAGGCLGLKVDTPGQIAAMLKNTPQPVTVEVMHVAAATPVDVTAPIGAPIHLDRMTLTSKAAPPPPPEPEIALAAATPIELQGATLTEEATKALNGLSFAHPVDQVKITSRYGGRSNPTGPGHQFHVGQDYGIACGKPVRAVASGTVIQAEYAGHSGNRITVDHGQNITTAYSHNTSFIAHVGLQVERGQIIAAAGTTGNSTGCHVHLELIVDRQWVNVALFLPGTKAGLEARTTPARDPVVALPSAQPVASTESSSTTDRE